MRSFHGKRIGLVTATALAHFPIVLASPALAQGTPAAAVQSPTDQNDAPSADIVVTGTSIRGSAPVGSSVQVVGVEQIRSTGVSNTNDILKTIPQITNLGAEEGRGGSVQSADSNITQAKTINLRGLGTESTLVLFNGRRIVKGGTKATFYDVSVFPTSSIGRIEVIADGASAVYGADAVGGVVNIITKRGRDGSETSFRYGGADGFDEKKFSQTLGFDWHSGDVFMAYEHYQRGGLLGSERAEVTQDLRPFGGPDLRGTFAAPGTITAGGITYAVPQGNGVGLTPGQLVAGTANKEDINTNRSLLAAQKEDNFLMSVHQELTDRLKVFAEGYFSDRRYDGLGSSMNRGGQTATLTVPRANPFFVHPTDPAASSVSVNYSFAKLIPPLTHGGERGYNIAAGLTYDIGGGWNIDAYGSHGYNHAYRRAVQVHTASLAAVLADPNPATAFNPFCDPGQYTCIGSANLAALTGYNDFHFYSRMNDAVAKVSGPLAHLPGGDLSIAVGGEYRYESLNSVLEFLTTTATPTIRNTTVSRKAKAAFAEVNLPIVGPDNASPGISKLQLSAQVRYDHYSDFGGTTNPKFGITYAPVPGLSFRASYSKSFRAPALADLDIPATLAYIPTNFTDSGGNVIRGIQVNGARAGISPETARIWTLGVDLRPSLVPGLSASLSYYNIQYTNRITTIGTTTILANPSVFGDYIITNPSATQVQDIMNSPYYVGAQEPTGNIKLIVDTRSANLGKTNQSGLDGDINFRFDTGASTWSIGAQFNYILHADEALAAGLPARDVLDLINYPVKFRGRGHLGWKREGISADLFLNHVSGYTNNLLTPNQSVKSWNTLDISLGYETGEKAGFLAGTRLQLSVVNATNARPPLVINTSTAAEGAYDGQNASVIGRFVAFEISKKW